MKILTVLIISLLTISMAYGQDPKSKTDQTVGIKKAVKTNPPNNSVNLVRPVQITSTTPKKESPYYLNDKVILEKLTANVIPSDYPKYNAKISKPENLNLIDAWMIKNIHLVKDKYKAQYK